MKNKELDEMIDWAVGQVKHSIKMAYLIGKTAALNELSENRKKSEEKSKKKKDKLPF